MPYTEEQLQWLYGRVLVILSAVAKEQGVSLKEVGLYRMPNKGKHLILDQFPTYQAREIVDSAYHIAKEELANGFE